MPPTNPAAGNSLRDDTDTTGGGCIAIILSGVLLKGGAGWSTRNRLFAHAMGVREEFGLSLDLNQL